MLEWDTGVRMGPELVNGAYFDVSALPVAEDEDLRSVAVFVYGGRILRGDLVLRIALVEYGTELLSRPRTVRLTGVYNYGSGLSWSGVADSPPVSPG